MVFKSRAWLIFLIFLNGYISLSLELIVLRQLSFFVGSSAVITSIIMGFFLGFLSLGYFLGESKRIQDDNIPKLLSFSFLLIGFLSFVAGTFSLVAHYFGWLYSYGIKFGVLQTVIYSACLLSLGPFLFGVNTTMMSRRLYKYNTNYTGNIMAWDTIGSVTASMLTTLVLMPIIGVNYTLLLIVLLAVVGAVISRPRFMTFAMGILVLIPTFLLNSDAYQLWRYGVLVNNANSTIIIHEDKTGTKVLNMNGLPMSVYNNRTGRTAEYVDYINNNFIDTLPKDKVYKILVLGAGGFTVGLNDAVNDYTFVDIEHTLKNITEKYFLGQELTPNKKFIVQDASQFLKNTNQEYDLILLDVYSNSYQVPEGFITAEFMKRIKARVASGGIVLMNVVSSTAFKDTYTRVFDNTFHSVFTTNTSRQVIGADNPWDSHQVSNVIYAYYNIPNDGRIYTINRTPIIYDAL